MKGADARSVRARDAMPVDCSGLSQDQRNAMAVSAMRMVVDRVPGTDPRLELCFQRGRHGVNFELPLPPADPAVI